MLSLFLVRNIILFQRHIGFVDCGGVVRFGNFKFAFGAKLAGVAGERYQQLVRRVV